MNLEELYIGAIVNAVGTASGSTKPGSMVTEEGGEARTINLYKRCHNERLVRQGKQPAKAAEWREIVERSAFRGKLWKVFGMELFVFGMWEYFTVEGAWAGADLADASKEKQEGTQGQWQLAPFKEVLEHIRKCSDMSCNAYMMRRACYGNWEGFKEEFRDKR